MVFAECLQIFQRVEAAPDLFRVAVLARQRTRHVLQLVDEGASLLYRPCPGAVEQSFRQNRLIEQLLLDLVRWIRDDSQSREDVSDDFVVGKSPTLGQAAWDAGVQEGRLEVATDFVGAV